MSILDRCRLAAPFSVPAIVFSFALASPLAFAQGGPFKEVDELRQQLDALTAIVNSGVSASAPMEVPVNCAAGDTIGEVLDEQLYSPAPLTIHVSGICEETVVVLRSNVTFQAAEPGAGVHSEDPLYGAITVSNGVGGIIIEGLRLSGGAHGVMASRNSQVEATNIEVTNTNLGVVAVDGALIDLASSSIHNNSTGVGAVRNGSITIADTVIEHNSQGVVANLGGMLNLRNMDGRGNVVGNVIIRHNDLGLMIQLGANANIANTSVEDGGTGVAVQTQSSLVLANSVIRDNAGGGVIGDRNTSLALFGNSIRNNAFGISCSPSTVFLGTGHFDAVDNANGDVLGCSQ